jgi:integrase/recombinase XerD
MIAKQNLSEVMAGLIQFPEIYARASPKKKQEALKKINPSIVTDRKTTWQKDGVILSWLKELQHKY